MEQSYAVVEADLAERRRAAEKLVFQVKNILSQLAIRLDGRASRIARSQTFLELPRPHETAYLIKEGRRVSVQVGKIVGRHVSHGSEPHFDDARGALAPGQCR